MSKLMSIYCDHVPESDTADLMSLMDELLCGIGHIYLRMAEKEMGSEGGWLLWSDENGIQLRTK